MNQFISSNQNQACNQPPNKPDGYRSQVPTIPPTSNMVFSPRSEQNFLMDNYVCQSYQSPMGSIYQPYSPAQLQPVYNGIEISTPVFLTNFARNFAPYQPHPDDVGRYQLPLKIENLRPDLISIDVSRGTGAPSFRSYTRDTSGGLKTFLHDQLTQNFPRRPLYPSINPADLITQPANNEDPDIPLNDVPPMQPPEKLDDESEGEEEVAAQVKPSTPPSQSSIPNPLPNRFENFIGTVYKIFSEGKIEESIFEGLPRFERELLYFLVKRKYQPKAFRNPSDCSETPTFERLTKVLQTACTKRPEECYKFILTRVIKHLKHRFEANCKTKAHVEELLYEVYFKETAAHHHIPLSDFHYPLTGSLKGKFKLNSSYFAKIFKSQMFVDQVKDYCQNTLLPEYAKDILKKLNSLFSRWNEMLGKALDRPESAEHEILEYVKFNKRCKLPWSVAEVRESIEKFSKLVTSYESAVRSGVNPEQRMTKDCASG